MFDNLYLKKHYLIVLLLCLLLICFQSCNGVGKKQKNDEFKNFEETWKLRAEESQGHSPSQVDRDIKALTKKKISKSHMFGIVEKPLPKKRVSLKMSNENVGLVLKALARAVNLNIIISSEIKGNINIDIKKVPWDEAFKSVLQTNGLAYTWEGSIIRIMTVNDMQRDIKVRTLHEKQKSISRGIKKVEDMITKVIKIDYADAAKLAKNLKQSLTNSDNGKRGYIDVNDHTNSLIIQGIPSDIKQILELIEELDRPTPQILIEADIIQTNIETARNLGIQWGGKFSSNVSGKRATFMAGKQPQYSTTNSTGNSGENFGFNFPALGDADTSAQLALMFGKVNGNILDMQLSALETEGKIKIISKPSITTLDNQTASTSCGTEVPYIVYDTDGDRKITFKNASLLLKITPHVINNNYLKMELLITKDEVDFSPSAAVSGYPSIKTRKTETTLIAKNKETIVISGLSTKTNLATEAGMPGLNKIPGLRWLFKNDGKSSNREVVLVFITPHILKKEVLEPLYGSPNSPVVEERDLPLFEDNGIFEAPDK